MDLIAIEFSCCSLQFGAGCWFQPFLAGCSGLMLGVEVLKTYIAAQCHFEIEQSS